MLGEERELLLTERTRPPSRVVKTRDGSALAPSGELPAADGPAVFLDGPAAAQALTSAGDIVTP